MPKQKFEAIERVGDYLVEGFHLLGLFIIGAAVVWGTWAEIVHIVEHGGPTIKDILLLFMYLELGAMVGIYFKTKHLPVRFLLYIAVTALTRILAVDAKTMSDYHMLAVTAATLLLALSVLVLRYASHRFPSADIEGDTD